jgi:8-oxo-dGTP pyrophosphatase MutT (NUDIX family)
MRKYEFISTVFIVKDKKLLLLFNKKLNNWTPPGGHIEEGEKPCESVIRETKEETGYDIKIIGEKQGETFLTMPKCIHLDRLPWGHDHINLMYFAKVTGGNQKKFTDEGWVMKWFSKEDLDDPNLFLNIRTLGNQAIEELK